MNTYAPSWTNSFAVARAIPEVAAVMTATLPSSFPMVPPISHVWRLPRLSQSWRIGSPTCVSPCPQGGRAENDGSTDERPRSGALAVHEPGPDRVEDRLEQHEERCFERRQGPQATREEGVGAHDLEGAEVEDNGEVSRGDLGDRTCERQAG